MELLERGEVVTAPLLTGERWTVAWLLLAHSTR